MRTFHYFKNGLVSVSHKDASDTDGGYQFERLLRKALDNEHVPHVNLCCDSEDTVTTVRYNTEDSVMEYYDVVEDAWTSLAGGDVTLGAVVADSVSADTITGDIVTDSITEATVGAGITLNSNTIRHTALAAHNTTGTATAAEIVGGTITSTSAAAVALTLDTVANIVSASGATRGTVIDFYVDNGVGANTVTVTAGTGMTASSAVTGGTTLTVASGVVGQFRLYIQSGTTAKLSRIA